MVLQYSYKYLSNKTTLVTLNQRTNKMRFIYIILFLFCYQLVSSQNNTNFSLHKQFYVYGDATTIGNNILSKHKKKGFDESFVINDQVKMRYIDIDNDRSTFSSSQATLNIPENTKKIVNATLYWSAIYSFNRGVKKRKGNNIVYKGDGKRDATINQIKFKTPNNSFYQNISGKILFDRFKFEKSKYTDNAPYVCYADVTDIISESQNRNGNYTVANIKATQGFTSGGSSAGWLLHIVYETETDIPKYITTYHGLSTIKKTPLDIKLKDFKTVTEGPVKPSLTLAALEGDSGLNWDQCLVYNTTKSNYTPLENKLRSAKNFFNSSITINEENFKDRLPYSVNNLGFDIVEMDLPNKNNELISNGATSLALKFNTKSDGFHLFFASFKTEVDATFFKNKKEDKNTNTENFTVIKNVPEPEITTQLENSTEIEDTTTETTEVSETPFSVEKKENKEIQIRKNIYVNNLEPGYYIITNVFSNTNYAKNWENFLINKYHQPKTFINPKNQWQYISVYNSQSESKVRLKLEELQYKEYFKDLWIQKINMDF